MYKTNLMDAVWWNFTNGLQWPGGALEVADPTTDAARFYRIEVELP